MNMLALAFALYVALGLLALSAWAVWTFATKALAPKADWTSVLVFRLGQALIWAGALLLAGGIFATAARAVWELLAR